MNDRVVGLPGVNITQPVPEVVQALERILEQAKTGYIQAVGFGYVRSNLRISYGWHGVKSNLLRLHLLHSALNIAATDMGVEIANTSTDVDPNDPTNI